MEKLTFVNKKLSWYIEKLVNPETFHQVIDKMNLLGFELIIQEGKAA
jgi:hypothetical protein